MILIVDDHPELAKALERLLRKAGEDAIAVTSGQEALDLLQVCKPVLMVLDVRMPGMDGLAVLRTLGERGALRTMKVAMYSADTDPEIVSEARRLGAVDFLSKGKLDFDHLLARITELAA